MTWIELLTPWLPLIGTLAGALLVGLFAVHNRRRGNEEQKMPSVADIWARQDRQALELSLLHTAYARLRGAFSAYVFRVRNGGSVNPTASEKRFLVMSSSEASQPGEEE